MSRFAAMTVTEWIGLLTLIFFAGMLLVSLILGQRSPPPDRRAK